MCLYFHENVHLLLGELQRHTDLSSGFAGFVKQFTCDESSVECIYRREIYKNQLDNFAPLESNELLIKYHQWQTVDKKTEKVCITATVSHVFDELKNQVSSFLIHRYIKRKQSTRMEKLINECDGESVLPQIDFSENASLLMQNEIQSAHWNHNQVTVHMHGLRKTTRRASQ